MQDKVNGGLFFTLTPDAPGGPFILTQSRYDSNGSLIRQLSPEQDITEWEYDGINRPVSEATHVFLDSTTQSDVERTWSYDGLQTVSVDRNGRQITRTSDPVNNTLTELWSDGHTFTQTYNPAGQLENVSDADTNVSFAYDVFGRMDSAAQQFSVAGFDSPNILFDISFNPLGIRDSVELFFDSDLISTTDYRSDVLGRVTGISQQFDLDANAASWWFGGVSPDDRSVAINYHPDGRRQEMIRLDREDYAGSDPYEIVAADWRGLTKYTYTNADSAKLGDLEHFLSDDINEKIARYGYSYEDDPNGGIRVRSYDSIFYDLTSTIVHQQEQTFTYDGRHQLTGVTTSNNGSGAELRSYKYDKNGNRREQQTNSQPDPAFPNVLERNRLLEDEFYTYAYDQEGNLLERVEKATGDQHVYTWDHRNRLTTVEVWSGGVLLTQVTYAYDGLDRLIGREEVDEVSDETVSASIYVLYGTDRVLELAYVVAGETTTAGGQIIQGYLNGPAPGEILANDFSLSDDPFGITETLWAFADPVGTLQSYVTADAGGGAAYLHRRFDRFGNFQGSNGDPLLDNNVLRVFDGQFFDAATELYVMAAGGNVYLPQIGRTLTGDSYAYQQNNPIHPEKITAQAASRIDWETLAGPNPEGLTWFDDAIRAVQGVTNVLNFGFSNYWTTRQLGGDVAGIYQQGAAYWTGTGVGIVGAILVGNYGAGAIATASTTARAVQGAALAGRTMSGVRAAGGLRLAAAGYTVAGDVTAVTLSSYHLATGQFSAWDTLGFLPTIGWGLSGLRLSQTSPTQLIIEGTSGARRGFRVNPGRVRRSVDEATALAKQYGVEVPEFVDVLPVKLRELQNSIGAPAEYFILGRGTDQSVFHWSDLLDPRTGKVPVRIKSSQFLSDEAVVSLLAHEFYELSRLKEEFDAAGGFLYGDALEDLITSPNGRLHREAVAIENAVLSRIRSGGPRT